MNFIKISLCILFFTNLFANSNNYGRLLINGNCITCHHPTKNISAPSLKTIKNRYLSAFKDEDLFVEYMVEWVYKPSKEKSIMLDKIEKYELMPELGYDKETLKQIAKFIYRNDLREIIPKTEF